MAATRWLDPGGGFTLPDYLDETLTLLPDFLWPTHTLASNERVSFMELTDNTGYDDLQTFPAFSELVAATRLDQVAPDSVERIKSSIHPITAGAGVVIMETDSFQVGVLEDGLNTFPDQITLIEVLTNVLGYASGTLLIDSDSSGANRNCLMRTAQIKQFYEVMNYQDYYGTVLNGVASHISPMESLTFTGAPANSGLSITIEIIYNHTDTTFQNCTAFIGFEGANTVDLYVANDLNESSPFSTMEEIRTYAIGLMNANNSTYSPMVGTLSGANNSLISSYTGTPGNNQKRLTIEFFSQRFKVEDANRPTPAQFYTYPVWWNGFYSITNSDFSTGFTHRLLVLEEMPKDGNDFMYTDVAGMNYNTPTIAINKGESSSDIIFRRMYSQFNTAAHGVFLRPNQTDGTAYEYYTP